MIARDDQGVYQGIKCDDCGQMAPPADEVLRGHGLNNMGWNCSGGVHLCPTHTARGKDK